jgi:hypothetical protein
MNQFSREWWLAFGQVWNTQEESIRKFAGLGKVIFNFSDGKGVSVCLNWDKAGKIVDINMEDGLDNDLPTFSATRENWPPYPLTPPQLQVPQTPAPKQQR